MMVLSVWRVNSRFTLYSRLRELGKSGSVESSQTVWGSRTLTVTAVMAVTLAVGATPLEAAVLANHAAAVEVGKAGVATVNPEEILNQQRAFLEKEQG